MFVDKEYPLMKIDDLSLGNGEYGAQSASSEYDVSRPRYIRITDINDDGSLNDDVVSSSNKNDDPPKSIYGFVTSYTGESDQSYNYLQCIITLGGMLETVSPGYDRVLLVPSEIEISSSITDILMRVWTHIIRRPFINCSSRTSESDDDYLFKLQAWTLVQYSKVLYIGADVSLYRWFDV